MSTMPIYFYHLTSMQSQPTKSSSTYYEFFLATMVSLRSSGVVINIGRYLYWVAQNAKEIGQGKHGFAAGGFRCEKRGV